MEVCHVKLRDLAATLQGESMKSNTLSKVTLYVFLWTVAAVVLVSTGTGMQFLNGFISKKEAVMLLGASLFLLFFLVASRVFSYLALSAHKGQSIKTLVSSYHYFYILLTVEARQEWRDFIAKEREQVIK
jgi:hypothetical protein